MKLQRLFLLSILVSGIISGVSTPSAWSQTVGDASPSTASREAVQASAATQLIENPQIQPGDVLSVSVSPATEYTREATVQPDGKIELPLIGTVPVGGLNARDAGTLLEARYARFLDHPKIIVAVRHFSSRRVAILGEVHSPGYYEYRDGMQLLELIARAGGLNDLAKPKRMNVLRRTGAFKFNFQKVLDGHVDQDLVLLPGDTIIVPKTFLSKKAASISSNFLPYIAVITSIATLVILAKTPP